MRKLIASLMVTTAFGTFAHAGDDGALIVVELFTSEGCSSCPPADEMLTELAEHDDILALALHVDYWDYLGWKDKYAKSKFTDRQAKYNSVLPSRYRLVTPQMVFNGRSQVAGAKGASIEGELQKMSKQPDTVSLKIEKTASAFSIDVDPSEDAVERADVFLIQYMPETIAKIKAGENRGRTLKHTNIVTSWEKIGDWNGQADWTVNQPFLAEGIEGAVIVQAVDNGPILAARKLR